MGAWGYKPFSNDAAHDWVDGLEKTAASYIRRALLSGNRRNDSEVYAAAGLLVDLTRKESLLNLSYHALETGLFERAEDALARLLKDDGAIASWKEPAKYRAEVGRVRLQLARRRLQERHVQEEAAKRIVYRIAPKKRKVA